MFAIAEENKHLLIEGDSILGMNLLNGIRSYDFILIDPPNNLDDKKDDFKYIENLTNIHEYEIEKKITISKDLLKDTGVIAVYMNDKNYGILRKIMDKVFGTSNYKGTFTLKSRKNVGSDEQFPKGFELIIVYSKTDKFEYKDTYKPSLDRQREGYWKVFFNNLDKITGEDKTTGEDKITKTELINKPHGHSMLYKEQGTRAFNNYKRYESTYSSTMTLKQYWNIFHKEFEKTNGVRMEFIRETESGMVENWVTPSEEYIIDTNMIDWLVNEVHGKQIYGLEVVKNLKTAIKIIDMFTDKSSKVLDVYAKGGTTGQAVMELNAKDGGIRVVTLITNNEEDMCSQMCYPRVREVSKTYNQEVVYMTLN